MVWNLWWQTKWLQEKSKGEYMLMVWYHNPGVLYFMGLIFYMALVKLDITHDIWRKPNFLFSVLSLMAGMPRDIFRVISWNHHHMSEKERGTEGHGCLFTWDLFWMWWRTLAKLSTFLKNLSINEKIVATKAHPGTTQYMKDNPNKWRVIFFISTDSSSGYTVQLTV